MRKFLLTATVATVAALGLTAAHAIDVTIGGGADVDVTIGIGGGGVDLGAGVGIGASAAAGADGGPAAEAPANVTIRVQGGADATLAAEAVANEVVYTSDGARIGTVASLSVEADGETVFIVSVDEGWMENIERIAVRASAMVQADGQLRIDTTEADLRASIAAGLAAGAGN